MAKGVASILVVLAAAAGVIAGYVLFSRSTNELLQPNDVRILARGDAVYVQHCASCHGPNLEGQPDWQTRDKEGFLPAPPHDQSGHTWHHPDKLLINITKLGLAEAANLKDYKTRMPVFGDVLTDDEVIAVLSYIKSTWPEEIQIRHDQLNRAYESRVRAVQ
ncbi:cytochrome c [Aminobacter anthyllidis]|uniref:c-type cytochrome n=1 Tax=Aminobacter anthyllidis TaxID=1035067 RepID=UPI002458EB27|nr:cytochrome c [Aminobacter anthyllidis]MDH4989171.1 cytochrome c [Aminobacter anthyllidis]